MSPCLPVRLSLLAGRPGPSIVTGSAPVTWQRKSFIFVILVLRGEMGLRGKASAPSRGTPVSVATVRSPWNRTHSALPWASIWDAL